MRKFMTIMLVVLLAAMAVMPAAAQDENNIVAAAERATSFNTLLAAAEAAGLADTLATGGPFTVFAPTDGAFATLLNNLGLSAEELLADTDLLTTVLTYHVVAGEVRAADLLAAIDAGGGVAELETIGGEVLTARLVSLPDAVEEGAEQTFTDAIFLGDAGVSVFLPNISASNGVIHAISGVLLPPSVTGAPAAEEAAAESNTIVDIAATTEGFSTLVAAAEAAGLVEALSGGNLTVFAPTDDAFAAALEALGLTAEELLADTETLTTILTFHVVSGDFSGEDLVSVMTNAGVTELNTLSGEPLAIALEGDSIVLGGGQATVAAADIEADNGIIHVIDGVLLPPSMMMGEEMAEEEMSAEPVSIPETAAAAGGFETLLAAAEAAGLVEALSGGNLTVFAPTDDAFAAALESLGLTAEELLADTETLTAVLSYHVVNGDFSGEDLVSVMTNAGVTELNTLGGAALPIALEGDSIVLGGGQATVVAADIEASNGIIHVIDGVLLPE
ncbi:MAG: fasciclin domain-containing protein [Chloroflexota bacterium]